MWLRSLLDLIFPPACEVCRQPGPEALCQGCFAQIGFMKPQLGIYSATLYEGIVRTALHRLKFQNRRRLAEPLGVLMVQYLTQTPGISLKEIDAIVPVPLHKKRLRQRGFNQAELLAGIVGRYYDLPVVSALERVRDTNPQFDLSGEARRTNVKGSFKVADPRSVYNRRLLLLDDIYTTGSTITESSRVLMTAGARRVEILTLSRAIENSA